ncbi:MAG: hypothetical protein ACE14S_00940 [Candidatus Bathyarchaeia archaeon]
MQSVSLNKRQSIQLCDEIGKMLATELDSAAIQTKVRRVIADYTKANMIEDAPEDLMRKISWSVKVEFKK